MEESFLTPGKLGDKILALADVLESVLTTDKQGDNLTVVAEVGLKEETYLGSWSSRR